MANSAPTIEFDGHCSSLIRHTHNNFTKKCEHPSVLKNEHPIAMSSGSGLGTESSINSSGKQIRTCKDRNTEDNSDESDIPAIQRIIRSTPVYIAKSHPTSVSPSIIATKQTLLKKRNNSAAQQIQILVSAIFLINPLDFIKNRLGRNCDADLAQKQQRQVQSYSGGWKPCHQLKHYKQSSQRQRTMGMLTEPQTLCFVDRLFDITHLPAGIPTDMSDMKLEANRLKTFAMPNLPAFVDKCKSGQTPEELAADGFFYLLDGDRVKCAFCLGVLSKWVPEEGVRDAHIYRFNTCPFLLGLDVGNVPIPKALEDKDVNVPTMCSEDYDDGQQLGAVPFCTLPRDHSPELQCCAEIVCRPRPPVSAATAAAACRPGLLENLEMLARSLSSPETAARYHPMQHPDWSDPSKREDSLSRSSQAVPFDLLANAGFFLDAEQHTTCYWCGLKIVHWLGSENSWVEHARWSPRCCHLLLKRGYEFVLRSREFNPPYQPQRHKLPPPSQGLAKDLNETMTSPTISYVSGSNSLIDYRIEPRYFKAREDFPSTLAMLQVGCDPEDVKTAQFLQLKVSGDDFPSYEQFLRSVLAIHCERQTAGLGAREFGEKVQREKAQAFSQEPKSLGDDEMDWRTCKVCMDKVINVTLLDCKHLCCCSSCAKHLDNCPLCRTPIRATMLIKMD